MARFSPKIVTANILQTGEVVYLTGNGSWSPWHAEAELLADEEAAAARLAAAQAQNCVVVDAYLADAGPGSDGPVPLHIREAFRTRGPSNYSHGKQETRHA